MKDIVTRIVEIDTAVINQQITSETIEQAKSILAEYPYLAVAAPSMVEVSKLTEISIPDGERIRNLTLEEMWDSGLII
jgi:hypothetical protein